MSVSRFLPKVALWALILAPASMLLHELAHLAAGLAMGYPVQLNLASVSGGPSLGLSPNMDVALQASAGPAITLMVLLVALVFLKRRPSADWAFALAIVAPARSMVGLVFLYYGLQARLAGQVFRGQPNFDEFNAATALGVAPTAVVAVQTAMIAIAYYYAISRRRQKLLDVGLALVGGIAGMALWMTLIGPALLGFW